MRSSTLTVELVALTDLCINMAGLAPRMIYDALEFTQKRR